MHWPLAEDLAARGNRVITVDLLGHGESDRPSDMWRYSMAFFAAQVIALMDHLEIEQAVVMGTSLGANTALEMASAAPERLRGMVIEMPVLDNGLLPSALTFTPILVGLTFGEPVIKELRARCSRGARGGEWSDYGNVLLDPAGAIGLQEGRWIGGPRVRADDLAHPPGVEEFCQADPADTGIVGDDGEILGALLDQPFDQRVGQADAAEAAEQHDRAVADSGHRLGHALYDLVDHGRASGVRSA